jgi:hypothetical protein
MATKLTDQCLAKVGDDEPIFVLRAQDRFAPTVVRVWIALVKCHAQGGLVCSLGMRLVRLLLWMAQSRLCGVSTTKTWEAEQLAAQMERWPTRKYPD